MAQTMLITGATGAQGGAVIKGLLAGSPVIIHALVRDPTSTASQRLSQTSNIKLFKGDFDDIAAIKAAAMLCTSAFLNVTPVFTDPAGEARHARNLIEACASISTLKRIVFSSSGGMQRKDDDPVWSEYIPNNPDQWMAYYMKSKKACEEAVMGTSEDDFTNGWTIIRGGTFLTNFLTPAAKFMYPELETKQIITTALKPEYRMSVLDPNDIGGLAAEMLSCGATEWNEKWKGKATPLAKEELTMSDTTEKMNVVLRKAGSKKEIKLVQLSDREAKQRAAQGDMVVGSQTFQNEYMATFDLGEIARAGVDLGGMAGADAFFEREKERLLESVGGM
ncbi:hypothetical protein LTR70_008778 [Exophiala xenobiotica]|nr:hypothetical protein LTR70_008778 [Exophiala xenobiotica]